MESETNCYPVLRERGQVTIPEDVREVLGADVGDRLRLTVALADSASSEDGDGEIGRAHV